ncbi:hypothetical protein HNQ60_002145 [Povalibacter uvarum]|uniref:Uncharacterized protein n=1 Tax=Povalibacter uvarum TaxID=732238 RepID=A0A841HJP6_9GAMM|nr:hypothetical protein [Povalibacter uvarum]MBB6093267.1 hypothetical protein [Povalibacter uvarum]
MSALTASLINDLPRLAGLAIALLGTIVVIAAYLRRDRRSAYAGMHRERVPVPKPAAHRDVPTVRLADSQRVDRLRKLVRLAPGEHIDVLENVPAPVPTPPRFRITLKRVLRMEDGSVAVQIAVDFGGTAVSCGPLVEETAFNEFVLPRAARDEPRNCVFHYQEHGDSLDFMRIKLRSVDMDADIAEIDVMKTELASH